MCSSGPTMPIVNVFATQISSDLFIKMSFVRCFPGANYVYGTQYYTRETIEEK